MQSRFWIGIVLLLTGAVTVAPRAWGRAPAGRESQPEADEKQKLEQWQGSVKGHIVWSTSRVSGLHDIWIMNADGSNPRALTKTRNVDWFPRLSPDGQTVLFVRSVRSWEPEINANYTQRWQVWTVGIDGKGEKKIADNGSWATWVDEDTIAFVREDDFIAHKLETGDEETLIDGNKDLGSGWVIQQPTLSPDGKYVSITMRGRERATGVFALEARKWKPTGVGCQINWFPAGDQVYWINQNTGNGGTELFKAGFADGHLVPEDPSYEQMQWYDLPGHRSHEYFPKLSPDGGHLVWCATARGHDHDIFDYEVYIKKTDAPIEEAVRLSFHSGNDRWPDVYIVQEDEANEEQEATAQP
jgi:hypothetical protein